MTINSQLSATELKNKNKLNKQNNRDRIMDTESVLMVTRCEKDAGEWVRGVRSTSR